MFVVVQFRKCFGFSKEALRFPEIKSPATNKSYNGYKVAFNFFLNRILSCLCCSQIYKLFHPFKGTIIILYNPTSSCILTSRHNHILSFISIYF
jgi:hypothetical protein